jgi:hypothetical protein
VTVFYRSIIEEANNPLTLEDDEHPEQDPLGSACRSPFRILGTIGAPYEQDGPQADE